MSVPPIQALYVDPAGIYPKLLGAANCWDAERDARLYTGPAPAVAHPPCQLWVNMAAVNWKRYQRQLPAWYPGGHDGGCFTRALDSVRTHGGVLEHPASTHAWGSYELEKPAGAGWSLHVWEPAKGSRYPACAYWVCEVWQSAYGHAARKRTWLLYCGQRPPFELRWDRQPGTHQVGWFDRNKPSLSKRAASATPEAFARALLDLAEWSRGRAP